MKREDKKELTETQKLFANVSKIYGGEKFYHSNEEWAMIGAKKFKRITLGPFRTTATKSLEEMAKALYQTGIVESIEKGKDIVPTLVDKKINYETKKEIVFREVPDIDGKKVYKIIVYNSL
jgi:hypothetical protein